MALLKMERDYARIYIERLKKLLGFGTDVKRQSPIPTEVIDQDPEGDFIALLDRVRDKKPVHIDSFWNSNPPEIHIGLDFGTSYTKACWYYLDKAQRRLVTWNESWNGESSYFLPSRLWLDSENVLHIAVPQEKQPREIRYFKMAVAGQYFGQRILPGGLKLLSDPYRIYAAFYIARCFEWIEQQAVSVEAANLKNRSIVWSCNMGVPISYFDSEISQHYQELLTAARHMQKAITDSEPMEWLDALYQEALQKPLDNRFLPVPELYAEACGVFSDFHTPEGYYTLFDVGGGTVDGAVMRFERVAGEPQVNFLTASVEALGAEVVESCRGNGNKLHELRSKLDHQTAELIMDAKHKAQADWREYRYLPGPYPI
ncbi:MAG: hypothetical protein NT061_07120 [Spirochaetes bacterium]|nr:hypothetical protein [Spirochaetota bacterium]